LANIFGLARSAAGSVDNLQHAEKGIAQQAQQGKLVVAVLPTGLTLLCSRQH
jgi:hypothetical protein